MERYQPRIHLVELGDSNTSSYSRRTGRASPLVNVAVSSTAAASASWSAAAASDTSRNAGSGNSNKARDETRATSGTQRLEVDTDLTSSESQSDSLGVEHVLRAVSALGSGGKTWSPVAVHTFLFWQLRFIAVTAYQNQLVRIPPLPN